MSGLMQRVRVLVAVPEMAWRLDRRKGKVPRLRQQDELIDVAGRALSQSLVKGVCEQAHVIAIGVQRGIRAYGATAQQLQKRVAASGCQQVVTQRRGIVPCKTYGVVEGGRQNPAGLQVTDLSGARDHRE